MKNVILIGFMGTGKSSCGRVLAHQLGFRFVDLDRAIERRWHITIPEMFSRYGEEYFREKERIMVKEYAGRKHIVLATGGGTVKNAENVALLKTTGAIVCLTATPEVILSRTNRPGRRPVLDAKEKELGDRLLAVKALMEERRYLYDCADYQVDTGEKTPLQVAQEIIGYMKRIS